MGIESWLNRVHCGDALQLLKAMPKDSVDMAMFSPPYWGLRDYGSETETIWSGDSNCEHEWIDKTIHHDNLRFRDPNQLAKVGNDGKREIHLNPKVDQAFCAKCGAWKGQLGLEHHHQLYVEHLVQFCRLVKRVLKKSGSMYIVIGDTYFGGGRGQTFENSPKQASNRGSYSYASIPQAKSDGL